MLFLPSTILMLFYNFSISTLSADAVVILIIMRILYRLLVVCRGNLLNVINGLFSCITFNCVVVIRSFVGSCLACIRIVYVILAINVIILSLHLSCLSSICLRMNLRDHHQGLIGYSMNQNYSFFIILFAQVLGYS